MGITVSHQLSATTPDDPGYEIQPQHWNQSHAFTLNAAGSEISGAFGNGGGVTFGLSADGKITASAPSGGGGLTNINVSAGTTSNNLSALTFNNGNGVTFGLNASTITGSVNTSYRASNDAVGLNTALTAGPLAWTVNSNGITLNASSAAGTTSGFTGGASISGSMTHNTAGLALSLSHPAWISTQSGQAFSAAGGSSAFQTLVFTNSNGVSWTNTNGSVAASVATTYRASNDALGLNTAQSNVTWTANSAGVSLDARGYAGTNTTFAGANVSGSMTLNSNGLNLSLSAGAGGGGTTNQTGPNIAAGGVTVTDGTVVFSNSNGVSFGLAGSTMTASVNSVPAGTATMWWPFNEGVNVMGQQGNATWHVVALPTPAPAALGEVHIDRVCFPILVSNSSNSTGSATVSMSMGLYTKNGASLSLAYSTTGTLAVTYSGTVNNSTYAGIRLLTVPWTTTIGDGRYYVAVASRTTSGGTNCTISQVLVSQLNSNFSGLYGANSNRSIQWPLGFGVYSASSSAFPDPIPLSQIDGTASLVGRPPSWFMINGTV